jgi:myo-inositol 2-dehydrogenase / D-chiro-inositol 1-dehydrogenase
MKKVKIGIIGLGRIGKIHFDNLKNHIPGADIVMVADTFADLQPFGMASNAADELINHTDIDAVVICSPTDTHSEFIEKCANAGKHIFCEKPHDLSLGRVLETLEVVKDRGVKLMLGFNRRFDPNFQKIKELVVAGKIGDPQLIKITSRDPSPPSLNYLKSSGGMFLDMSIHDFDMARFIMGKEVKEVFASTAVFTGEAVKEAHDIDTAVTILKFEDDSMAVIDNSRKAVYGYDQRLEVFGSMGMAKVDNNKPDTHVLYNADGTHGPLPLNFFMDRYVASYLAEMKVFIDSLLNDIEIPVNGLDGLEAMKIALAANISYKQNRPVLTKEVTELTLH